MRAEILLLLQGRASSAWLIQTKTDMKHTLLLSALALVGVTTAVAGPSDAAAFALRHANSQSSSTRTVAASDVKYVTTSNNKGGTTITSVRDSEATSIALMKSSKGDSCCSGGSCKAR